MSDQHGPTENSAGRPLKYATIEELQSAIDAYFESCWEDIETDGVVLHQQIKPYTMAGLANSLGLCRKTLINYERRDEYLHAIKNARERVHQYVEEYLFTGKNTVGAIFNLKNNFGWKDKSEHEHTGKDGGPIESIVSMPPAPKTVEEWVAQKEKMVGSQQFETQLKKEGLPPVGEVDHEK